MSFFAGERARKYAISHSRPTKPLVLPRDDAAHYWAQIEWWYYTGRLVDGAGRIYGFELTFFKRITNEDNAPILRFPAHWLKAVGMVSHFAVADVGKKKFAYKTILNLFRGWRADPDDYHVAIGGWSARREGEAHLLCARMNGHALDLVLTPAKGPALHGEGGVVQKGNGSANYYYSYTNMHVEGTLAVGGERLDVTGKAWMDHEYGTIHIGVDEKGWDWFGLALDDDTELMVFMIRDINGAPARLWGTFVDGRGDTRLLSQEDLEVVTTSRWYSARTHAAYPASWEIRVKPVGLALEVRPLLADQELVTRPMPYWEGIVGVTGRSGGRPVSGHGYAELVGYSNKRSFKKYHEWVSKK